MTKTNTALILACVLFLFAAFLRYGDPQLNPNEADYLIKSKQIANPEMLAADWSYGETSVRRHGTLYSLMITPLWMAGLDAFDVALVTRFAQTLLFLAAGLVLLRSLRLPIAPGIIGLAFWVVGGQFAVAGEWVLGSAEQKPFAYTCVVLALAAAIRGRWYAMALLLSLATWFHILVGGWSAMFVFLTLLLRRDLVDLRTFFTASAIAAITVAPALYMALFEFLGSATTAEAAVPPYRSVGELLVSFRVPHHLDPSYIFTPVNVIKYLLVIAALYLSIRVAEVEKRARDLLTWFVAFAISLVVVACISYYADSFRLLTLYPFRIADGMIPLLACLLAPYGLIAAIRRFRDRGPVSSLYAPGFVVLVACAVVAAGVDDAHRWATKTIDGWQDANQSEDIRAQREIFEWARTSTDSRAQFFAPPWWHEFRLLAERPIFVGMKTVPNNAGIWDWYRRLVLANNASPFSAVGFHTYAEMMANYPRISPETMSEIASMHHIDYFVSLQRHDDVPWELAFSTKDIYVYRLTDSP